MWCVDDGKSTWAPFLVSRSKNVWYLSEQNNHAFQNCKPFLNWSNHYREIVTQTWPPNEQVYSIWCRPEVDGDVISSQCEESIEGYVVVNFEVACSSNFRDFSKIYARQKKCDGERFIPLFWHAPFIVFLFQFKHLRRTSFQIFEMVTPSSRSLPYFFPLLPASLPVQTFPATCVTPRRPFQRAPC